MRKKDKYCDGAATTCNGALGTWKGWAPADDCSLNTEVCVVGQATCQQDRPTCDATYCTSGVCCDLGINTLYGTGHVCEVDAEEDYGCPDGVGCGDDVKVRKKDKYCDGAATTCNGALGTWKGWAPADDCSLNTEVCVVGQATCQQDRPTCDATYCTSGVCCDTGTSTLYGTDHICLVDAVTEYGCPDGTGCGDDLKSQKKDKYCDGIVATCNGSPGVGKGWTLAQDCTDIQQCNSVGQSCDEYDFHDEVQCVGLERFWYSECGIQEEFIDDCDDADNCTSDYCATGDCINLGYSCHGHGTCNSGNDICTCNTTGYTGDYCDQCDTGYYEYPAGSGTCIADPCLVADPCNTHGACDNSTGAVVCTCNTGYGGDFCGECAEGYIDNYPTCELDKALLHFVYIPKGEYEMGCSPNDADCAEYDGNYYEEPRHTVTVSAFEMTQTEVTNEQYVDFLNVNGNICHGTYGECVDADSSKQRLSGSGTNWTVDSGWEDHPVLSVTWYGAKEFCEWLGGRLPSEAEWEYAARAGTTTKYYCGDDESCLDDIAWYSFNNSDWTTHEVAQKTPNAFGLYDILGNLWEWTQDCYHENYIGAPSNGIPWEDECSPSGKMVRGGSYPSTPPYVRVSCRTRNAGTQISYGFRCARNLCADGYMEDPENPGTCIEISCAPDPCNGHGTCSLIDGSCSCDEGYNGLYCDVCAEGYIGYPDCVDDPCHPDPCMCYCDFAGDDFEDEDYSGWSVGSGNMCIVEGEGSCNEIPIPAKGANGTSGSLFMVRGWDMGMNDGLHREFAPCAASRISFWLSAMVCAPSPGEYWDGGNNVFLSDSNGNYVLGVWNFDGAWAANYAVGQAEFLGACQDDAWVHFELVFDWDNEEIDVYMNDDLVAAGVSFYTPGAADVARIDLFHSTAHTEYAGWFDEIELEAPCSSK